MTAKFGPDDGMMSPEEVLEHNKKTVLEARKVFKEVADFIMAKYPSMPNEDGMKVLGLMIGLGAVYESFFIAGHNKGSFEGGTDLVVRRNAETLAKATWSGNDVDFEYAARRKIKVDNGGEITFTDWGGDKKAKA